MKHSCGMPRNIFSPLEGLTQTALRDVFIRGKKLVIEVGSKKALGIAVKDDKTQKRFTWLRHRLKCR